MLDFFLIKVLSGRRNRSPLGDSWWPSSKGYLDGVQLVSTEVGWNGGGFGILGL